MFTDLLSATQDYWHKLDEVEAAYKRDEMTIEEVDAEVKHLMTELGKTRRRALKDFGASVRYFVQQQREILAGTAVMGLLTYVWIVNIY
jgi:lipopolysaccharide export system protein LptA